MSLPLLLRPFVVACGLLLLTAPSIADPRVSLVSKADAAYTERKYGAGKPRTETYVFMQGRYFEGRTVDRSIERTPFRRIAEYLAPELGRQNYLPAPKAEDADLLIVVHWGTTLPVLSIKDMKALDSTVSDTSASATTLTNQALSFATEAPVPGPHSFGLADHDTGTGAGMSAMLALSDNHQTMLQLDRQEQVADQVGTELTRSNNIALLGYTDEMYRMRKDLVTSATEYSLRHDLNSERYFVILKAYDLRTSVWTRSALAPVWSMHLNMSSPGNNFQTAMNRMSAAAVNYLGRSTVDVRSVRPDVREGRVDLAPLVIIKEIK